MNFLKFPPDVQYEISLFLSPHDLGQLCKTNSQLNKLSQDERIWETLFARLFKLNWILPKCPHSTWRQKVELFWSIVHPIQITTLLFLNPQYDKYKVLLNILPQEDVFQYICNQFNNQMEPVYKNIKKTIKDIQVRYDDDNDEKKASSDFDYLGELHDDEEEEEEQDMIVQIKNRQKDEDLTLEQLEFILKYTDYCGYSYFLQENKLYKLPTKIDYITNIIKIRGNELKFTCAINFEEYLLHDFIAFLLNSEIKSQLADEFLDTLYRLHSEHIYRKPIPKRYNRQIVIKIFDLTNKCGENHFTYDYEVDRYIFL